MTDGSGDSIVDYVYNSLGRLVEKLNGNGTHTSYAYDANGDLTSLVNYADATTVNSSFAYTYDLLDRPTSKKDATGATTSYAYDAIGQLTQVTLPDGRTITYVYDAAGNRSQVVDNGTATNYTSNADNEITKVGTATYTYDANGNLRTVTDASGTTTYTFNDLNQLVSITAPDGTVTTFQYNPLGFLVGTNVGGAQTGYLVDPTGVGDVVAAYAGGSLAAHYIHGLGLVGQAGPSGSGYYDFDASANTVGITGAGGAYANRYDCLPFGQTTTLSAALPNPFTFAGLAGVMQFGADLFYMRARNYTPATGQFLSPDPIGLAGRDVNLRRYAGNSPTKFVDPMGTVVDPVSGGILLTLAGIILFESLVYPGTTAGERAAFPNATKLPGEYPTQREQPSMQSWPRQIPAAATRNSLQCRVGRARIPAAARVLAVTVVAVLAVAAAVASVPGGHWEWRQPRQRAGWSRQRRQQRKWGNRRHGRSGRWWHRPRER